jgi:hypothetical protein
MKRKNIDIKKLIKKRNEIILTKQIFLEKNINKFNKFKQNKNLIINNMNHIDRERLRIYGKNPQIVNIRISHGVDKSIIYQKKAFVDYDVVICIPSFNRYEKVKRLIKQFYQQPTKYTFKIILLNDGSTNLKYKSLTKEFPNIIYLSNDKPNGKVLHWYCYNQMWEHLKNIQCHTVLQMDDDFILSDNFLDNIVDLYFQIKETQEYVMVISPHLWSFNKESEYESWWKRNDFVDGIALIDDNVIKFMNYEMKPVDAEIVSKPGTPVQAWTQIGAAIKSMCGSIYRTDKSLVYHDGNDDSKLHCDVRKNGKGGVYTQKYIGKL